MGQTRAAVVKVNEDVNKRLQSHALGGAIKVKSMKGKWADQGSRKEKKRGRGR